MRRMLDNVRDELDFKLIMFVAIIVIIVFSLCRGIFVSDDLAYRVAKNQGFKNVMIVDTARFAVGLRGCSINDVARFTIQATNPGGDEVEFYVCSGWPFKGATIRTK